jgi:nuclear transport factor 2 (NTF2) superfamily protein
MHDATRGTTETAAADASERNECNKRPLGSEERSVEQARDDIGPWLWHKFLAPPAMARHRKLCSRRAVSSNIFSTNRRKAMGSRPPFPPFSRESAVQKVRLAEDGWNSRDPEKVAQAYTTDSHWRNRSEFVNGTAEIVNFLRRKWAKELEYRLIKEMWAFTENHIAVRFAYEWHDDSGNWFRSYGNENWEFNSDGLMQWRYASINDLPIKEEERKYHWPLGKRPETHPGLSELGL